MNVLLVTQHFDVRGGSDVIVHHTRRLLEEAGHTAHIFAARNLGEPDDGVFPDSSHFEKPRPATVWRAIYNPEAKARLDAFLERHPVDVAHLHIHYGVLTSSIIEPLRRRGIPAIQHLHEYRTFCSVYTARRSRTNCTECRVGNYLPGLLHRCNRGSLPRSLLTTAEMYVADRLGAKSYPSRFLTVTEFQRHTIEAQGMPADRLRTLYNPADPMFFSVEPERTGGVLFVGRIEEYKGIFDLLELAARLPHIPFRVAGTGNAAAPVRRQVAERKLTNVKLLGSLERRDLLPQLAWAKLLIIPSRWHEPFGVTAVEAMAAGLPTIVTRMGGLPEVVQDGVEGFLVDAGDLAEMKVCIEHLCSDEAARKKLGQAARERARTLFSEQAYMAGLMEHYEDVIGRGSVR